MSPRTFVNLLTALILVTTLFSIVQRDLFVGDETKYGEIIREMRAAHSFFVPILNGEPYGHKPPLHFWAVYLLTYLFGLKSVWPFVLPSLLGYIALVWITGWIAREFFGDVAAPLARLLFSAFYLAWGLAQTGRMDHQFVAFIGAGMLFLYRYLTTGRFRDGVIAAALFGLGTMVKGPMAAIVPLFAYIAVLVRMRQRPRARDLWLLLIVAAIPLAWLIPATLMKGEGYLEELLVKQSAGRAFDSWVHKEPLWYYVAHYPATFFPWFLLFIFAAIAGLKRKSDEILRGRIVFCLIWVGSVLVAFSALSGKLDIYMLPALPAAAILMSYFLTSEDVDRWRGTATTAHLVLLFILAFAGCVLWLAAPRLLAKTPDGQLFDARTVGLVFAAMGLSGLTGLIITARRKSLETSVYAVAITALLPLALFSLLLMRPGNEVGSTQPLVRELKKLEPDGTRIALYQCPFLWSRDLPDSYLKVRYIGARGLAESTGNLPSVVVSRSTRTRELALLFERYRKVGTLRMIGKEFDVYQLR